MSSPDPCCPVIIGAAQAIQRLDTADLADALDVVDLLIEATRAAAADAGTPAATARATYVGAQGGRFRYPDPAAHVADAVGAGDAVTARAVMGGNMPQAHFNEVAGSIQRGELDHALLVGGETGYSRRLASRVGQEVAHHHDVEQPEPLVVGEDLQMGTALDRDRGLLSPTAVYAAFESAIRADRRESHDEHRRRVSELWAEFNRVATTNPFAWNRSAMTAEEIRTPSAENRMIGYPYTKVMNANNTVDLASAVIVCSARRAEELGVPRDRWVFLHAGTDTADTASVLARSSYHRSPGIEHGGRRVLSLAGVGPDDLAHVDLYSCFPAAVQTSARELGLDDGRPLTVTGGLTFAGAPLNNYSGQALPALVERLRTDGGFGLLHANGGFVTKHSFGVFGTTPPKDGFRHESPQELVDAVPAVAVADGDYAGPVTVEAYTVMHDRDGSRDGLFIGRTPDGMGIAGRAAEPPTEIQSTIELVGETVGIDAAGDVTL